MRFAIRQPPILHPTTPTFYFGLRQRGLNTPLFPTLPNFRILFEDRYRVRANKRQPGSDGLEGFLEREPSRQGVIGLLPHCRPFKTPTRTAIPRTVILSGGSQGA
jgi:hypothetical protein